MVKNRDIFKLILIPMKLIIFVLISQQAFKMLSDEDVYYENRKTNNHCQKYLN
jgi:hypothetical protein